MGFHLGGVYIDANWDPDDPEVWQLIAESGGRSEANSRAAESGGLESVWDAGFSSVTRSEMYRAWVEPDLFPKQRQPVLSNWPQEDLEAFCGIYDKDVND